MTAAAWGLVGAVLVALLDKAFHAKTGRDLGIIPCFVLTVIAATALRRLMGPKEVTPTLLPSLVSLIPAMPPPSPC